MAPSGSRTERVAMHGRNKLKLGFFGSKCSSGRFVTKAPERWSGSWDDNLRLARMADEAGIDFLLPVARWKGYGGDTDYQGATCETITWATGLLAVTKRITVFGTVHAALFPPLIAAKQMVTADRVSHGRFGLNGCVAGQCRPASTSNASATCQSTRKSTPCGTSSGHGQRQYRLLHRLPARGCPFPALVRAFPAATHLGRAQAQDPLGQRAALYGTAVSV